MASALKRYGWILVVAAAFADVSMAQPTTVATSSATTQAVADVPSQLPEAEVGELRLPDFWPDLGWTSVCWFAAVVILALTIRLRPLFSMRNLDALVLAAMCLLLALRATIGAPPGSQHTWHWWAYLGLTASAVYWLLRGMALLASRQAIQPPGTVSAAVRLVLVLAGLALSIQQIVTAPLSDGSRDGLVGGLFTAATGKLPYGDVPGFEERSPLVYLVHAAAVRGVEPSVQLPGDDAEYAMGWANHDRWLTQPWPEFADLTAVRLVNAALFVGILAGLLVIGTRLRAEGSGWLMVAVFCVFPGTLECLPRPEIMLPALLLTWTVAFALLPGLGGLLATVCLVLAGVAWPWAWLGLPLVLAYFWRRGWQALGSFIGLAGGAALCWFGLTLLMQPALPRTNGALALAGLSPSYAARLADQETVVIDRRTGTDEESTSPAASSWLWRWLVARESIALKQPENAAAGYSIDWPNSVSGDGVLYRDVVPTSAALPVLQGAYRDLLAQAPAPTRALVAARTLLEFTWLRAGETQPETGGAWALWGGSPVMEARWIMIRRVVKVVVLVLVLWATLAIWLGRRNRPRHMLGAILLLASGSLLASDTGAVTNLAWLLPLVTALWAVHEAPPTRPVTVPTAVSFEPGPAPRITLETGGKETPH